MVKLIDMFKKLKSDYEERQEKINDMINNTNMMMVAHTEAMESFKSTLDIITESVADIQTDYIVMKNKLEQLKKNPWLRLFGVR